MQEKSFENRKNVIVLIVLIMGIIFSVRLLFVQIIDKKWDEESIKVSKKNIVIQPARGIIFDRNGEVLAVNKPYYELEIFPIKIKPFDTTELCKLINLPQDTLRNRLKRMKRFRRVKQIIRKNIPETNIPKLISVMYKYEGFELIERFIRNYPEKCGSHLLGYVREVDQNILNKKTYYRPRDLIGITNATDVYSVDYLRAGETVGSILALKTEDGVYEHTKYICDRLLGAQLISVSTVEIREQQFIKALIRNIDGSLEFVLSLSAKVFIFLICSDLLLFLSE